MARDETEGGGSVEVKLKSFLMNSKVLSTTISIF